MSDPAIFLPTRATRSGERARFMGLFQGCPVRALDGWMLARAPASPAQGLHHLRPWYFNFLYFCSMCGHEKLGLELVKLVRCVAENAGSGYATTIRVDRGCSRHGVGG